MEQILTQIHFITHFFPNFICSICFQIKSHTSERTLTVINLSIVSLKGKIRVFCCAAAACFYRKCVNLQPGG